MSEPIPDTASGSVPSPAWQAAVGVGVLLVAAAMALGALGIPGNAGYGGVGPNFLPWLCAAALALCGALLVREAFTGGYRAAASGGGEARAAWMPFVWVTAGLLANAALIETLGFVFGCTLCYALAVQGLRRADGQAQPLSGRTVLADVLAGLAIAAPVFWLFTQFLAIGLPGLTRTGWI